MRRRGLHRWRRSLDDWRLGLAARGGVGFGRLLAHLLEILLDVLLKNYRHFIAADVAAGIGVGGGADGIRGAELLLAGGNFDGDLTGDAGGALADNFADLAHGGELLGEFAVFVSVLAADAAASLVGGLLI